MANYKVVDAEQLEADLTVVADAIREKGGTSEPLAFPNGMVDAVQGIQSGGSGGISATKVVDVDVNIDASTTTAVSYAVDDLEFISSVENPTKYNAFANNDAYIAFVTPKEIIGEPNVGTDNLYNRSMIVMNGNTNYTPTLTNLISMGNTNVSNQNYGVYALKLNCKDIANGKPKGNMSFSVRHHANGSYEVLAGTYNIQVYYLTDWIWGF